MLRLWISVLNSVVGNIYLPNLATMPRPVSSVGRGFERSQSGATLPRVQIPVAA